MTTHRRTALIALLVAALGAGISAAAAGADVAGPDDSVQQAFGPMQPGTWYAGAFVRADDVDHLSISVPLPNSLVHVDVENTVSPCLSPDLTGCPIWGTLVDGAGLQVGGEGSSAGTGRVDAGTSDVIDWVFATPGTYFLALDSAGDLPTYRVRQTTTTPAPPVVPPGAPGGLPGGGATTPGSSAGSLPAAALSVARRQRGTAIRARIAVRRPLRRLTLSVSRGGATLMSTRLTSVRAGKRTVALRLGPASQRALARAGQLALTVRLVAVPASGTRVVVRRSVTLVRPAAR